jgi:hypothetical protein
MHASCSYRTAEAATQAPPRAHPGERTAAGANLRAGYAPLIAAVDELSREFYAQERAMIGRYLHAAGERTNDAADHLQHELTRRRHQRGVPVVPSLWA